MIQPATFSSVTDCACELQPTFTALILIWSMLAAIAVEVHNTYILVLACSGPSLVCGQPKYPKVLGNVWLNYMLVPWFLKSSNFRPVYMLVRVLIYTTLTNASVKQHLL